MKVIIHTDDVILTAKQKAMMEKKLMKMKRYSPEEPMTVDLTLKDDSGTEKGGVDQKIHISAIIGKEKIFVEELDDRIMRAFAIAAKKFERQLSTIHKKNVEKSHKGGRLDKIWRIIRK